MGWLNWSALWQSPQWLWMALALAVPLLIHLLQRSAPREITFAAAHWLQRRQPQSWKRLQLRDRWLLALRLLLLAALVALVAGPLREPEADDVRVLLVDPQIGPTELDGFLREAGPFERTLWLQPRPAPVASGEPHSADLWHSLTSLAPQPEFRSAHVLLRAGQNPAGYHALRYSPHWQWHTLEEVSDYSPPGPVMAVIGEEPRWLGPAFRDLGDRGITPPAIQSLDEPAGLDPAVHDWLLYNRPGPLPAAVREFARAGGLLITDGSVTAGPEPGFIALPAEGGPARQAAALGRGSWLRYDGDWNSGTFFRHPDLPRTLWRHWTLQDWPLQAATRPRWSQESLPGAPIPDEQVSAAARAPIEQPLLLALLLLLLVERTVSLSRGRAHG